LEIPAELLLDDLSEKERAEHVRVGNIGQMINIDIQELKDTGFGSTPKDLEPSRFMSDWCLWHFLQIHRENLQVRSFEKWLSITLFDVRKMVLFLDSLHRCADECTEISLKLKRLAFAVNEDILTTQLARLTAEAEIVRALLNYVNFTNEKDKIEYRSK
jgi:hypothetical protein